MKVVHYNEIIQEVDILHSLNHPNVIQFIDMYVDYRQFYIITDAQHMNMREYVNTFFSRLSEAEIKRIKKFLKKWSRRRTRGKRETGGDRQFQ